MAGINVPAIFVDNTNEEVFRTDCEVLRYDYFRY